MVLAFVLLLLAEPRRGGYDAGGAGAITPLSLGASLRALVARRSWISNTVAQVIYTFAMGGLATWMPTYFVRERGLTLAGAASTFGLILVAAGFIGTLAGGRLSAARRPRPPAAVAGRRLPARGGRRLPVAGPRLARAGPARGGGERRRARRGGAAWLTSTSRLPGPPFTRRCAGAASRRAGPSGWPSAAFASSPRPRRTSGRRRTTASRRTTVTSCSRR